MLEDILLIIFFCSIGIPIGIIVIAFSITIARNVIDVSEFLIDGPPEGFTIPRKTKKSNTDKKDPIPLVYIHPGSNF